MNIKKPLRGKSRKGFTLIEILVVIGLIAILAEIVLIAINPARQFAQARNAQRTSNVNAILNAIGQNIADNKGIFTCNATPFYIAATSTIKASGGVDLRSCLVPAYLPEIPVDPSTGIAWTGSSYDTDYTVATSTIGRYTVCASGGAEAAISGSVAICVTR